MNINLLSTIRYLYFFALQYTNKHTIYKLLKEEGEEHQDQNQDPGVQFNRFLEYRFLLGVGGRGVFFYIAFLDKFKGF